MRWLLLTLLIAAPLMVSAEQVVLGLSKDKVAITTQFDGSDILVFGAIKRDRPAPSDSQLGVIVAVKGPSKPVVVRRKAHRYGIWINTDAVTVDAAPSFYAVAATAPLADVLSATEDLRHKISIKRAIRSVGAPMTIQDAQPFSEAVIRIREEEGLYQLLESRVALDQDTLFRTSIRMPANLTEGEYSARIFLTRNKAVISTYETTIDVRKVGLERFLFSLSREQPLVYGLMSLAIAIAAGWGASAAFQIIRNR